VALLLSWNDVDEPTFGIIEHIILADSVKYFLVQAHETVVFHWKLNAYELRKTSNTHLLRWSSLVNTWPIPVFQKYSTSYVTNRYAHFGVGVL